MYDGLAPTSRSWVYRIRCRDLESFVDDIGTWQRVALGRSVLTLQSVETQPVAWELALIIRRPRAIASLGWRPWFGWE